LCGSLSSITLWMHIDMSEGIEVSSMYRFLYAALLLWLQASVKVGKLIRTPIQEFGFGTEQVGVPRKRQVCFPWF